MKVYTEIICDGGDCNKCNVLCQMNPKCWGNKEEKSNESKRTGTPK